MIDYILTLAASSLAIGAYAIFYLTVKKSGIITNRLAWIIFSLSISLETVTYCFVSNNHLRSIYFIVCAICTILITAKIWKYASWDGASRAQKYSLVFYSLAVSIWPLFQLTFTAHLLLLMIIPVTFFPIYTAAFRNYDTENSLPWLLWSISDLLVIISICLNMNTFQELPYALVNFICPFIVYVIIIFKRIRHSKNLFTGKSLEGNVNIPTSLNRTAFSAL
jgi:hypothetical protein